MIIPIRRRGSSNLNQGAKTLSYSPTENAALICSDMEGGSYELYVIPKDSFGRGDTAQEAKRGIGGPAVFVARNRFAVLEKSTNQVIAKNLKNEIVKKSALPISHYFLPAAENYCWGARDDNGVFIYTTLNHIKYCLPNGDSRIIRTLDVPVYITKVYGKPIHCLDRDGKNRAIVVDATEYVFKLSLLKKRYDQVMSMIRSSELCGQAMIAYLQQKGFPEVALHFVKDERTRFNLALGSGNIQIAVASAKEIDEKDHWYRLGVKSPSLLLPPMPIICGGDWPLLTVMRGIFEGGLDNVGKNIEEDYGEAADADWGEELNLVDVDNIPNGDISAVLDDEEAHEENEEGG
ncbi:hypothetical protein PS2_004569 [Malus domestica]